MNKLEFQHVCLVCRICDVSKEKKLIEKVFGDANKRRGTDPDPDHMALTRFEFFETLLNMAIVKFSIGPFHRLTHPSLPSAQHSQRYHCHHCHHDTLTLLRMRLWVV